MDLVSHHSIITIQIPSDSDVTFCLTDRFHKTILSGATIDEPSARTSFWFVIMQAIFSGSW
jgi:hypothetical protein